MGRRLFFALLLMIMAADGALVRADDASPAWPSSELPQARLAGQGHFTWFGMGIYRARLWVGPRGYSQAAPAAAPFVLELRYERSLKGGKIADASADEMEKVGAGSALQRAQWKEKMRAIFPDVVDGSRIAGVYLPGAGVHFYLDGQPLAQVDDPAFAAAFFAIWLSPATSAKGLRAELLRDAAPAP